MSHVNFLMNLSFLANIPFENVKSIYLFCEIKKFPLNAIIYTEEDETDYFYMIKSGQFLVYIFFIVISLLSKKKLLRFLKLGKICKVLRILIDFINLL